MRGGLEKTCLHVLVVFNVMVTTSSPSSAVSIQYLNFQRYPPKCVNTAKDPTFQVGFTITNDLRDEVYSPLYDQDGDSSGEEEDLTIHVGLVVEDEDEEDVREADSIVWTGPQSAYKMMTIDCNCLFPDSKPDTAAERGHKRLRRRRDAPESFRIVAWINGRAPQKTKIDDLTASNPSVLFLDLYSAPVALRTTTTKDIDGKAEAEAHAARSTQSFRRFYVDDERFVEIAEEGGYELDKHIWDASIHLSAFLARLVWTESSSTSASVSPSSSSSLRTLASDPPRDILELGSGTGLVSIVLACLLSSFSQKTNLHSQVVATDLAAAQPLLVQNIAANSHTYSKKQEKSKDIHLEAQPCDWTVPFRPTHRPDLILVSDCTYNPTYFADLCQTIASALHAPPRPEAGDEVDEHKQSGKLEVDKTCHGTARESICLLAKKHRHPDEEALWAHLRDAGLTHDLVAGSPTEHWGLWLIKLSHGSPSLIAKSKKIKQ